MEMYKEFLKDAEKVAFDLEHRRKIRHNISRYDAQVPKGKAQFADLENARCRAANAKHKILNDLEHYLVEFEKNFERNGGKVIWAPTRKDALREIQNILKDHKARMVVKSKSMISEELELNEHLEKRKIEAVETDLGEHIVQVAGEKPYHILTPAMHKSKEDVARLFHEKFGLDEDATPEQITKYVRKVLREKFRGADAGITGANFLIADTGSVCLTENEGNGLMSVSFPKVHIVIAGIEKLIPSLSDLHLFWPLLATMGTGQKVTAYNSILSGPAREGETDGPREMYVILLDNHRTDVMENERLRRAMSCIRCGACLNACPIYKNIGGYTYGATYTGPIGSVITPHMENMRDYRHLSYASTLCGNCTSVCPVKIPLHELLLLNRSISVEDGYTTTGEQIVMRTIRRVLLSRGLMNMGSGKLKNLLARFFFSKAWGPRREFPKLEQKPFNKMWKERQAQKKKDGKSNPG